MNIDILFSALIITCIFLIGANIYFLLRNRSLQQQLLQYHEAIKSLAKDNRSLLNADLVFGKKIAKVEKMLDQYEARHPYQTNATNSESAYNQAIALLNRGASIDEVVHQFGLSRAEVELLNTLKGHV